MKTSVIRPVSARIYDVLIYKDGVCVEKALNIKGHLNAMKRAHFLTQV